MRAWNQLAARWLALPQGAAEFCIVAVSVGSSQIATLLSLNLLQRAVAAMYFAKSTGKNRSKAA